MWCPICDIVELDRREKDDSMDKIKPEDLSKLKKAYDAYSKYPTGSRMHERNLEEYNRLLSFYCGKYHTEPYQLRIMAGIE